MANYAVLKAAIEDVIKANGNNEITGQSLQDVLIAMTNALGADYQFAGVATPATTPGTPDNNVVYIAGAGTYPNFGGTIIKAGSIGVFSYNGSWTYDTIVISDTLPAYININEIANHPAAYANAAAALADVPVSYRRKGVKVVYYDDDTQLWIEMLCIDDFGGNDWWTEPDNWVVEGPVRTEITEGGASARQLQIGGVKRANLDDFLNVNVWNGEITPYDTKENARLAVPVKKRKSGLTITYLLANGWVTEQFVAPTDWGTDSVWVDDDNWKLPYYNNITDEPTLGSNLLVTSQGVVKASLNKELIVNAYINNSGLRVSDDDSITIVIPVIAGKSYKLYFSSSVINNKYFAFSEDFEGQIIIPINNAVRQQLIWGSTTIEAPVNAKYINICVRYNGGIGDVSDVQFAEENLSQLETNEAVASFINQINESLYEQEIVDLSVKNYTNTAYTLNVGQEPTLVTGVTGYLSKVIEDIKIGEKLVISGRSGSSYYGVALAKNGIVTSIRVGTGVNPYNVTIECDGSFDSVYANSYNKILSIEYHQLISKTDGIVEPKVRILCFGNSFTLDSMSYVPAILKNLSPNIKLTLGIAFIGACNIPQHTAYFTGETIEIGGWRYYTENGVYKKMQLSTQEVTTYNQYTYYKSVDGGIWNTSNNKTVDNLINDEKWDIITFQQGGAIAPGSWDTYYKPYIYKLQQSLFSKIDYAISIGWILTHGSYSNSDQGYLDAWEGTALNAKNVMDKTGTTILFPYGTAVQNLRSTPLITLGDGEYHNLTADNIHLQEGLGCLAAAYTNCLVILSFVYNNKNIIGDTIRPTNVWIEQIGVPGPNMGTSGVIGINDKNCFIAQIAAIKAISDPYNVTDLSDYYNA